MPADLAGLGRGYSRHFMLSRCLFWSFWNFNGVIKILIPTSKKILMKIDAVIFFLKFCKICLQTQIQNGCQAAILKIVVAKLKHLSSLIARNILWKFQVILMNGLEVMSRNGLDNGHLSIPGHLKYFFL